MINVINPRRAAVAGIAGVLLATLAIAPVAHAATFYACVKKKGGSIRLASRTARCKRGERKISFNSEGPPGRNGLNGRNGRNGSNGLNGINGVNGMAGFTKVLPIGATEEGTWAVAASTAKAPGSSAISFDIPLASAPVSNLIAKGASPTSTCPGRASAPAASPGNLCVYTSTSESIEEISLDDPSAEGGILNHTSPWGTTVRVVASASPAVAFGTWAVTG
jgi:hypothetical protein